MKELFLGIDGGGSKTEFMVAGKDLEPIKTVRIDKASNPWAQGIEATLSVLREGLSELEEYRPNIVQCVAGISGCFTPNNYSRAIEAMLSEQFPRVQVVGDLPISFRAGTDRDSGIIAIAGSGSSVVHFFSDGTSYVYDGVGAGGRDLGFWLARAYTHGTIKERGRDFLELIAPILKTSELRTTRDYYHNDELRHMAARIGSLDPDSKEWLAIKPWVDIVADRWQYKLYGIVTKFMQKEPDADRVALVLSGGLWKMDAIREPVSRALVQDFEGRVDLHLLEEKPAIGAVKMAQDVFEEVTR
jgi:N-acetylglucosamine kinase-like BadF-type ATPase